MPTYFISHISIAAREAKMKTRTRVWQPNILPQSRFSHWDTPSSFTLGFSDFSLKYQRFHCAKTRNARLSCAPNCKGPRFLNGKRSESSGPAEPVLDRAASVRASLDAHVAIPVDTLLQIPLEDIGVVSLPIAAKLGLGRREEVLGLRVVEAVSFAGHGPGDPRPLEREPAGGHPVLPAH